MKYRFLSIIIIFMITIQMKSQEVLISDSIKSNKMAKELIQNVKSRYAPDISIVVFDIISKPSVEGEIILTGSTNLPDAYNALKNIFSENKIPVIDSIKLLPDSALHEKMYGVINISVSNHRTRSSFAAELSTQSLLGTPINILEKRSYWYRVQTPDNYISWVDNGGIQLMTKDEINSWLTAKKIVYWKQYGQSYKEPNDNSQPVSDLVICNVLKYIATKGKFIQVEYPDGRRAYVKKTECSDYDEWLTNAKPTSENLIKSAYQFMGLPYLWGGTSSKAVDCSGFTKMIYQINGVILQRDATQQALYGQVTGSNLKYNDIKPADLLFFVEKDAKAKDKTITHVGMYLGNLEFIHASGSVSINSFDKNSPIYSQFRAKAFLQANNYTDNIGAECIVKIQDSEFYKVRK